MPVYHGNDLRKISGGRKGRHVKVKRKYLMGRPPIETTLGREKVLVYRTRGGGVKAKVKFAQYANVVIPREGRCVKARIVRVVGNPSNRNYDRRGIITKGAIIQTELGAARVTSRPGQDGVVNAVLSES